MKYLLFLFIIISTYSYGQEINDAKILIDTFLKNEDYGKGELKIVKEINQEMVERQFKPLVEKTYFENPRFKSENINLTIEEKDMILRNIRNQYKVKKNDKDFGNIKLIDFKDIGNYLQKRNTYKDSNRVMMFTNPVFIRNNEIAIVYFMHLCCGSGGEANIWFYKKINEKWQKWIPISQSAF